MLGLANPTVTLEALDGDGRSKFFLGRQGEANIISESGLYTLILRSNKPEVKTGGRGPLYPSQFAARKALFLIFMHWHDRLHVSK